MKLAKRFAALLMGATLVLGSVAGLAACGENSAGTNGGSEGGDPNIRLVYDMYVENCAANNTAPQTYEEWLASIKGEKGDSGTNGTDGKSAYELYLDGYALEHGSTDGAPTQAEWLASLKGEDGDKGDDGDPGANGSSFLHGHGKPTDPSLGIVGDLYLDLETYDLYEKTAEGWSTDPVGNIKGAKGDKGDKGDPATGGETEPAETVIKEYKDVTINASESYQLDLSEVESGYYWLVADTQTAVAAGVLTAESTVSYTQGSRTATATSSYDLYSSKNTRFRGVVAVDTDTSTQKVTVYNKSTGSITADLKLVEYTPVTLTIGQEFEIPCLSTIAINGTAGRAPVLFDTASMQGKEVKITVTYAPDLLVNPVLRYNSVAGERPSNISSENWWPETDKQDGIWAHTFTMPANALELFFLNGNTANRIGFNAVVKIELAEA